MERREQHSRSGRQLEQRLREEKEVHAWTPGPVSPRWGSEKSGLRSYMCVGSEPECVSYQGWPPTSQVLGPAICGGGRTVVGDMRRLPAAHLPERRCSINFCC